MIIILKTSFYNFHIYYFSLKTVFFYRCFYFQSSIIRKKNLFYVLLDRNINFIYMSYQYSHFLSKKPFIFPLYRFKVLKGTLITFNIFIF